MEYIGAEVSHKIRSAIKAKLMELGAYVDEELPDYIMVMVANKRAKAQMDGDLQLFLGSNTSHFTSWLYQVLQKLQEVTVGNLDKKSSKLGSAVIKDAGSAKRKSLSSADCDTHRKEKRRKSSESKRSKKGELDLAKDSKRDLDAVKSTKFSEVEKYSRAHSAKDLLNVTKSETSDSVVSSSADSKTNKKTLKEKREKLQDSSNLKRTVVKQSLSNGNSKCDDKNYLSRLRAEALRSCDERMGARTASDAPDDLKSRVLCRDESEAKHLGTKSVYSQPQRTKIVLMNSDDEDDDEDFINIKADAEAEQLLKEELPREALEATAGTPEGTPSAAEGSAVSLVNTEASGQIVELVPEGRVLRSSELPTIPLNDNLVPKRLSASGHDISVTVALKPGTLVSNPVPGLGATSVSPRPVLSPMLAPSSGPELTAVSPSTRLMRKRLTETEGDVAQAKIVKEEERPIAPAISIKNRLGLKKTFLVAGVKREPEPKVAGRLGVRHVAAEQRINQVQEEEQDSSETISKRVAPSPGVLSRVVPLRPRRERTPAGSKVGKRDLEEHLGPGADEEEEYDPSNPAVGTVASVVRVKPRPKVPAALQANKNLILKAVAEAQKSVSTTPLRPEPPKRQPTVWKRTNAGFVRKIENNVGITFPNRHLQSHEEYDDGLEEDIKPDSTRLVSGGTGNDKIIIKVSSTNSEKAPSKEASLTHQSPEEMSDEDHLASVLQFHEEDEVIEEDDDMVERDAEMVTGVSAEEPDSINGGRSLYPPVGLASRMPRERTSQQVQYNNPQFLVTLDGLDPDVFGSRSSALDDQAISKDFDMENLDSTNSLETSPKKAKTPIVYKVENTEENSEPSTLPKSLERCKYWPSCRLGSKCNFHHPVSPCKTFPKCPFGDKCLYIHPFCKFNSACTRRDCPFVHAAPRLLVAAPRPVIVPKSTYTPVCRFFPNCSNVSCRFLHPKACRYGKFCSKQDCNYIHQDIPSVDKLKWTSPFKI